MCQYEEREWQELGKVETYRIKSDDESKPTNKVRFEQKLKEGEEISKVNIFEINTSNIIYRSCHII